MLNWTDETSYSRNEKDRLPRVLECELFPNIKMTVHKHIHYGDEWLLSSEAAGFDKEQLGTADINLAKRIAIRTMTERLKKKCAEFKAAILELECGSDNSQ